MPGRLGGEESEKIEARTLTPFPSITDATMGVVYGFFGMIDSTDIVADGWRYAETVPRSL